MIDLRAELSDNTFSNPTMLLDNNSTLLTEEKIDKIIKWCLHNGYPFEIPYKEFEKNYKESEKPRKYELFKKILRDQKRFGFKVGDFLISLNNLYCCYKMYSVLSNESDSIKEHLFLIDDKEPFDSTEQHDKTADKCKGLFNMEFNKTALPYIDLYGKKVDKCKELLNRQIKKIAWDKYVSIENEFVAQSLFDAALYQLAQIMQCKGKDVHICECCGHLFVRTNKNRKYCYSTDCYPQKRYARDNSRKRKSKNSKKARTI